MEKQIVNFEHSWGDSKMLKDEKIEVDEYNLL